MKSAHAEVAFSGESSLIREFYEFLGVRTTTEGLVFEKFEILYGGPFIDSDFQICIDVDSDIETAEAHVVKHGGRVVESGFDMSGPFIVANDPAGLKLRIGLSIIGIKNQAAKYK
jgi:predicted enzyme related to lactoylglutathione lyase